MKDKCVLCGDETSYTMNTPIDERYYYVEGAGQLCEKCYNKIYKETIDTSLKTR